MTKLNKDEIKRYSRHLLLSEVGIEGQEKLRNASVLIIGAGGLGSPLATYLAACGVGTIGVIDFDRVDESNLQRQILFSTADVGMPKAEAAKKRLQDLNPFVKVINFDEKLSKDNAVEIIKDFDIVADGTDNFPTRYLINDVCMMLGKTNVYASIFGFEGQVSVFQKGKGACYRCLFPNPPKAGTVPSCSEAGVLGVLPGVMGTIQATEVIKLILGKGESLIGRLLLYNALEMSFNEIELEKNINCKACSSEIPVELPSLNEDCCENIIVNDSSNEVKELSPLQLKSMIENGKDFLLLDVRENYELEICTLPTATHIRINEVQEKIKEILRNKNIVVFCHLGVRSSHIARLLVESGHNSVYNLEGGIDLYAKLCDNKMQRY